MASRIDACFSRLRREQRKGLIAYLTAGYPSQQSSVNIILELSRVADAIELGVPCTDPFFDGPVIRESHRRALQASAGLSSVCQLIRSVRTAGLAKPIIVMMYMEQYRNHRLGALCAELSRAGADGLLLPELQDSAMLEQAPLTTNGLALIPFVSPGTNEKSLIKLMSSGSGFVYLGSGAGPSGGSLAGQAQLSANVARIRKVTEMPVAIGIGIKSADDARRAAACAEAIIVGSAITALLQDSMLDGEHLTSGWDERLQQFLLSLEKAISDRPASHRLTPV